MVKFETSVKLLSWNFLSCLWRDLLNIHICTKCLESFRSISVQSQGEGLNIPPSLPSDFLSLKSTRWVKVFSQVFCRNSRGEHFRRSKIRVRRLSCSLLSGFYTLVRHDDASLCSQWSIHSRSEGSVDWQDSLFFLSQCLFTCYLFGILTTPEMECGWGESKLLSLLNKDAQLLWSPSTHRIKTPWHHLDLFFCFNTRYKTVKKKIKQKE